MTQLIPLGENVLIEPILAADKTPAGILLPEDAREKPKTGKVIATGEGARTFSGELLPMRVKVGDTVMFSFFSGTEVVLDKVKYRLLREGEILGIVK